MPAKPTRPTVDVKPFYAYVGAGDAAIERIRERVATLPTRVTARVADLPDTVKTLPAQVKGLPRVKSLPTFAQAFPAQAKELPTQLRKSAIEFSAKAEQLYAEFASRGEKVFADLRGGKAKTATTTAKPTAKKPVTKVTKATKPAAAAKPVPTPAPAPSTETTVTTPAAQTTFEGTTPTV
jgi:hypothetical protein